MKSITLTTQGVKGGGTRTAKVGFVLVELRHDQDRISVDDFKGYGETYTQRETQLIEIIENGKILFSGDKYELFEILKKANTK